MIKKNLRIFLNGATTRQFDLVFGRKPINTLKNSHILCKEAFYSNLNKSHVRYLTTRSVVNLTSQATTSSDTDSSAKTSLNFIDGLVKLTVELPAKQEKCEFTLKPYSDTVGSLAEYIKVEDKSIEKAQIYSTDGTRLAQNTPINLLVTQPFKIRINDDYHLIDPPKSLVKNNQNVDVQSYNDLEEIRDLVSKLYLHLNIDTYDKEKEEELTRKLDALKNELIPLEKAKEQLAYKAKQHTNRMIWLGLGLMSIQAGIMARLTWFDYSWDIVEPISYFVTYGAVIGVYAYFVLTRKEYDYESASDRIFLRHFHKNAIKNNLNVGRYNQLKDTIYNIENDLKRIRESQLKNPSSK